jgi:hypothetical protein
MIEKKGLGAALFFLLLTGFFVDGSSAPPPGSPAVPRVHPVTGAKLHLVHPGLELDTKDGRIYVQAQVCLDSGILEFLLVQGDGKAYESAFSTRVSPSQLMAAMLLLDWKPADSLEIVFLLGKDTVPPDRFLRRRDSAASRADLRWRLSGSNFSELSEGKAGFQADREGIHIALVDRPEALIRLEGDPRNPYHNAAFGYVLRTSRAIRSGTPVTLILRKRPA